MQLLLIIRLLTVKPEGGATKFFQAVLCLIALRIPEKWGICQPTDGAWHRVAASFLGVLPFARMTAVAPPYAPSGSRGHTHYSDDQNKKEHGRKGMHGARTEAKTWL